jgi:hypothetical protein
MSAVIRWELKEKYFASAILGNRAREPANQRPRSARRRMSGWVLSGRGDAQSPQSKRDTQETTERSKRTPQRKLQTVSLKLSEAK